MRFLQTLFFGLMSGCFLIVATLGFAMISRIEKFLNIAHAELITVAAFAVYYLHARAGWNLWAAGIVATLVAGLVAVLVARVFYTPIRHTGPVVLLITSVGVVFLLHGLTEIVVKPGLYTIDAGRSAIDVGIRIQKLDLVVLGLAVASVAGLHIFLNRTRIGLAMRALASNEALGAARGINIKRVSLQVWFIAGSLAGVAGVLLALRSTLNTDIAFGQILLILSVSILAGLGSIFGVVIAGLVLGLAMDLSTLIMPSGYRTAIAFAMVILVLVARPEGISGSPWARKA